MSAIYHVTPYDPIHWRDGDSPDVESDLAVKIVSFLHSANARWKPITIYEEPGLISWTIRVDGGVEVRGQFRGNGYQILSLEGSGNLFNEVVAWSRTYITLKYELFLFVEGSWDSLQLTDGITEEDVARFTGY